jgi:hypothetical protein
MGLAEGHLVLGNGRPAAAVPGEARLARPRLGVSNEVGDRCDRTRQREARDQSYPENRRRSSLGRPWINSRAVSRLPGFR